MGLNLSQIVRDRVKEFRRCRADELLDHPLQYKVHGERQRATITGVLKSVGIAGALLAYESERADGALVSVDGHMRKGLDPNIAWPTLILDISDEESDIILMTYDPIAGLAEINQAQLDASLHEVNVTDPEVMALLADVAERAGLYKTDNNSGGGQGEGNGNGESGSGKNLEPGDDRYKQQYGVIVIVENEGEQREAYERLKEMGYNCKVVVT